MQTSPSAGFAHQLAGTEDQTSVETQNHFTKTEAFEKANRLHKNLTALWLRTPQVFFPYLS